MHVFTDFFGLAFKLHNYRWTVLTVPMSGRRCKINNFICGLIHVFDLILNSNRPISDRGRLIVLASCD